MEVQTQNKRKSDSLTPPLNEVQKRYSWEPTIPTQNKYSLLTNLEVDPNDKLDDNYNQHANADDKSGTSITKLKILPIHLHNKVNHTELTADIKKLSTGEFTTFYNVVAATTSRSYEERTKHNSSNTHPTLSHNRNYFTNPNRSYADQARNSSTTNPNSNNANQPDNSATPPDVSGVVVTLTSRSIVLAVNSRNSLQFCAYKTGAELNNDQTLLVKTTINKMLAIIIVSTLLITAHGIPLEKEDSKAQIQEQPQTISKDDGVKHLVVPEFEQPQPGEGPVADVGGAPLPGDLSDSPDANPGSSPGTSDLDTDSTFWGWGWGYRRPYYGWRTYYSPYRRYYGYGRGYGGWGWGGRWGWGGYYW
ncbi:hypothetical protein RN001_000247 [Aquatica leii]|uniref:Uncharacterized protein n=1 Tax=Aquatica leii TaxID=1421715 RepID=A0AAN7PJU3_9COLE|nr:hypothetical protein RN001_000247 [Aquatica leii]